VTLGPSVEGFGALEIVSPSVQCRRLPPAACAQQSSVPRSKVQPLGPGAADAGLTAELAIASQAPTAMNNNGHRNSPARDPRRMLSSPDLHTGVVLSRLP
jgi:hypothetical protein